MYNSCTLLFVLLLLGPSDAGPAVHWGYGGAVGPARWAQHFTKCGGTFQSPIDIETEDVSYDSTLKGFKFTNFDNRDSSLQWTLTNNGHTVVVSVNGVMTVTGGGLDGPYQVTQFHFHWGRDSSFGSEHEIDETSYPMELHIVSYKVAYGNPAKAQNYADGLAVLGILFEVVGKKHAIFSKLVSRLPEIHEENHHVDIQPFSLTALLPKDTNKYYRYLGSLTTPPCSEAVVWTIFRETVKVSEAQIAEFRKLTIGVQAPNVKGNFRPVQPLGVRLVRASFPVESTRRARALTEAETSVELSEE